jgi:hypothetical protein
MSTLVTLLKPTVQAITTAAAGTSVPIRASDVVRFFLRWSRGPGESDSDVDPYESSTRTAIMHTSRARMRICVTVSVLTGNENSRPPTKAHPDPSANWRARCFREAFNQSLRKRGSWSRQGGEDSRLPSLPPPKRCLCQLALLLLRATTADNQQWIRARRNWCRVSSSWPFGLPLSSADCTPSVSTRWNTRGQQRRLAKSVRK